MIVTYPIYTESYGNALKLAESMAKSHGFKTFRLLGITKTGNGSWDVRMLVS
jgi:hypothetical protein